MSGFMLPRVPPNQPVIEQRDEELGNRGENNIGEQDTSKLVVGIPINHQ